jgi:hypothetical protein
MSGTTQPAKHAKHAKEAGKKEKNFCSFPFLLQYIFAYFACFAGKFQAE